MSARWSRRAWLAGAGLTLSACATPYVQSALTPGPGFTGPRMEPDAFIVQDGARLPYLRWGPPEAHFVFLALHGMNDHKMSWHMAGPRWAEDGIITYAYDSRGFGSASGRGLWPGEALMAADLRAVAALVRARHPTSRLMLAGESMGGSVIICAAASDDPPDADGAVLLAPAVWGWSSQALPNRLALQAAARVAGSRSIQPPRFVTDRIRASDNTEELIRMGRDPEFIAATRFDALYGLVELMERASLDLGRMKTPALMMYGAHDEVVERGPTRLALQRAGDAPNLTTAWYPQGWHLLNRDLGREAVLADASSRLTNPTSPLPSGAPPILPSLSRRDKA